MFNLCHICLLRAFDHFHVEMCDIKVNNNNNNNYYYYYYYYWLLYDAIKSRDDHARMGTSDPLALLARLKERIIILKCLYRQNFYFFI